MRLTSSVPLRVDVPEETVKRVGYLLEKARHGDMDGARVREFLESREHALSVKDTDDFYDAAMAMERKYDALFRIETVTHVADD
jgi:hypothetical protein